MELDELEKYDDMCCMPKCGAREDATDNLTGAKLLTNIQAVPPQCGHRFCQSCTEREFYHQNQFGCPVPGCGALVRRVVVCLSNE